MAASGLLRERDLRVLTAVVEDGLRDDPGEAMPWAVLDGLHQLIPCQYLDFNELDLREQRFIFLQSTAEDGGRALENNFTGEDEPPYAEYWTHWHQFLANSYVERTGDLASVLRLSDFYTATGLKNAPFYAEHLRPRGDTKHNLFLVFPTGPGRIRRMVFVRQSGPDFGERDRLALQLLRPHLYEVYRDAERRRRGIPRLSPREREVLQLVSRGYSNADIARVLFISVSTVRKHMENIFNRTGVHSRSAAAALALPYASLATPLLPPKPQR